MELFGKKISGIGLSILAVIFILVISNAVPILNGVIAAILVIAISDRKVDLLSLVFLIVGLYFILTHILFIVGVLLYLLALALTE